MDPLTAATHKRRQFIMAIALAIAIPIINTLLQKWGLPPLPPLSVPAPTTTSTSGQTSDTGGEPTRNPFVHDCSACALFSDCATATEPTHPQIRPHSQRRHLFPIFRPHQRPRRHPQPTTPTTPQTNPAPSQPKGLTLWSNSAPQ